MTDSANTTADVDAGPRRELWILLAFLFTFLVVVICWGSVRGLVLFFNRYGMIVTEPEEDIDEDEDERVGGGHAEDTEAQGGERLRQRRSTSTRRRRRRRKKRCGNFCCCCLGPNVRLRIDWEAYRREQEAMRQLRAQRRLNRMQILQMAQTMRNSGIPQNTTIHNPQQRPIEFTTFSQIPGPIPNSFWASQNGVATSARGTPLGFIVFPQLQPTNNSNNNNNDNGGPVDVTSFQHRNHLTHGQRRQFLEKALVCIPYSSTSRQQEPEEKEQELSETRQDEEEEANLVSAQDGSSTTEAMEEGRSVAQDQVQDRQDGPQEDDGQLSAAPRDQPTSATASSSSGRCRNHHHHHHDHHEPLPPPLQGEQDTIASHSEPTDVANTCAICLENFEEGDLINDNSSKCAHFFHRECLLAWLDKHNICPCCRRPMITDWEWRAAIGDTPLELNTTAAAATTQGITASRGTNAAAVATTTTQFSATRMMYTRNPTRGLVSLAPAPSSSSSGAS